MKMVGFVKRLKFEKKKRGVDTLEYAIKNPNFSDNKLHCIE
jgi:hypothetical protein